MLKGTMSTGSLSKRPVYLAELTVELSAELAGVQR